MSTCIYRAGNDRRELKGDKEEEGERPRFYGRKILGPVGGDCSTSTETPSLFFFFLMAGWGLEFWGPGLVEGVSGLSAIEFLLHINIMWC